MAFKIGCSESALTLCIGLQLNISGGFSPGWFISLVGIVVICVVGGAHMSAKYNFHLVIVWSAFENHAIDELVGLFFFQSKTKITLGEIFTGP